MAAFDQLPRASFAGFEFPWSECSVKGGLRDHVHEYPHSPGGAPEKLGRKLYEIHFSVPFHNTFKLYPKLWPETIASLRIIFEGGRTFDLVIPTIGTIQAYATSWDQKASAKARSGEAAEFTFREDASGLFLVEQLIQIGQASLADYGARFATLADPLPSTPLFDAITNAVNSVLAIKDQADAFTSLIAAKALNLASLCDQADKAITSLNDPRNHELLDALHDLWSSSTKLATDVMAKVAPVISFVVPSPMSISSVSKAIYGDNSRSVELLRMNAIDDAFLIPAGTKLNAYAP